MSPRRSIVDGMGLALGVPVTLSIGAATAGLPALLERGGSRVEPRTRAAAGGDVAPVRTRLTLPQATACLGTAWYRVFGEQAPPQAIALLAGQWAHETGNGASMYNYNFGGIKGVGPSGLSVSQRTKEGWGENERSIVDRFRAYGSAEEGAEDYVRLLAKRYGGAIEAARQGDADEFVHQLKARGYFTGNEQVYAVSVRRLANQALDSIGEPALDLRALPELPILRVAEAAVAVPASGDRFAGVPTRAELTAVTFMSMTDALTRAALSISATERRRSEQET